MVAVSVTLEETNRSILSSVYYKIIDDIAEVIKLPKDSLVILYKDDEIALTDARPNISINNKINTPTTTTKRRIQATITEDYNEDHLDTTAVHQQEFYPIFFDPSISASVAPIYIQTDINISFSYITPSLSEANRIRDDIRLRLSQTRNISHHEVEYSIIIPRVVEDFIADVHSLKSRMYPQELIEYFLEHSTKRLYPITDLSNKENTRLAIQEKQIRILGFFNFSSMPEKVEKEQESSTYKLNFTYSFSLSIPKAMSIRYPVMICNKVMPNKYVEFIEQHKINAKREYKLNHNYIGTSMANLSHFEAHRQLENRVDINVPINIPLFDDFALRQGHKGYGILVSMLPEVNETDKKTLLNLKELDPWYIPDSLLNCIANEERIYMTSPYSSFLYLGLHQEDRHYDNSVLTLDSDMTIRSKVTLDLRKPVRVTLSMCIDMSTLLPAAIERILYNRCLLIVFISEYISANNTFKDNIEHHAFVNDTFNNFIIKVLEYYLSIDDLEIVKAVIEIISKDRQTSMDIGTILIESYRDLYEKLNNTIGVLVIPPYNYIVLEENHRYDDPLSLDNLNKGKPTLPSNRYFIDRGLPKTVMTTCVIATKQE